jgi:putative phosphoesterase
VIISGTVEIAIISDTHMPRGARALPQDCVARLERSELILHAGDLVTLAVLEELCSYGPVVAVHGNVDDAEVRARLPAMTVVEADGARIGLVHDAGPRRGRAARLRKLFPDADAVVFGHSHTPIHERGPDGLELFNPGSPTERRRAPRHTMGIARATGGRLAFELIGLG